MSNNEQKQKPNYWEIIQHIEERSQRAIDRAWRAYALLGGLIAILISTGAFIHHSNLQDIKNDLREEKDLVAKRVNERIDDEFNKDNIRALVEAKAQERIGEIADQLIAARVDSQLTPVANDLRRDYTALKKHLITMETNALLQYQLADKARVSLEQSQRDAEDALTALRSHTEFLVTAMTAESGNRAAYEALELIASNPTNANAATAMRVINKIQKEYTGLLDAHIKLQWPDGLDPEPMGMTELSVLYEHVPEYYERGFVDYVWAKTNFTETEKGDFLVSILKGRGKSLEGATQAAKLLAGKAGMSVNPPFAFGPLIDWWTTNRISETK